MDWGITPVPEFFPLSKPEKNALELKSREEGTLKTSLEPHLLSHPNGSINHRRK